MFSEILYILGFPMIICCCPCAICTFLGDQFSREALYLCLIYRVISTMIFSFIGWNVSNIAICIVIEGLVLIITFVILMEIEKVKEEKRATVPKEKYKDEPERGTQLIQVATNDENV